MALRSGEIKGHGLKHLHVLSNLEKLDLLECPITDDGLKAHPRWRNLRVLELNAEELTEVGLRSLPDLPRLESLSLTFGTNNLTQKMLTELQKIKSLKKLDSDTLFGPTFNPASHDRPTLDEVRKALPGVEVIAPTFIFGVDNPHFWIQ